MYAKIVNGAVSTFPYSPAKLKADNPNISFPSKMSDTMLSEYGVERVTLDAEPSYTERTQKIARNSTPTESNGSWTLGWTVTNKSQAEITAYDDGIASSNRSKRDKLLAETDYLALSDNTLTSEMQTYRQALRDISDHSNWPNLADSDWPSKP